MAKANGSTSRTGRDKDRNGEEEAEEEMDVDDEL